MVGPEVLQISGLFNGLQKSGTEKHALKTLCFFMSLPHFLPSYSTGNPPALHNINIAIDSFSE